MKKTLPLILAFVFCLCARAADGDYFTVDNLRYTVLSEVHHIVSLVGYEQEPSGELVIPSTVSNGTSDYTVTQIGSSTFYGCTEITSLLIPNSVEVIDSRAFGACNGLTSVKIPASVWAIWANPFANCESLTEILVDEENAWFTSVDGVLYSKYLDTLYAFPPAIGGEYSILPSVTTIRSAAFSNCSGLTSVVIPDSVIEIWDWAFEGCRGLTSIKIPDSVTEIWHDAFYDCSGLTSIELSNSLSEIGGNVFLNCTGLTSIKIPDSVTTIQFGAFQFCTSLASVEIPNSVTTISSQAFRGCYALTSIQLPDFLAEFGPQSPFTICTSLTEILISPENENFTSVEGVLYSKDLQTLYCYPGGKTGDYSILPSVTTIQPSAFEGCRGLTSIVIPNSVTTIPFDAFWGCNGLISAAIPDSVTKIEYGAFADCHSLSKIVIPASVEEIGLSAFSNCISLKTITSLSLIPPVITVATYNDPFYNVPTDVVVYIPKGSVDEYSAAEGWSYFTDFREMGFLEVSFDAAGETLNIGEELTLTPSVVKDDEVTILSESWSSSDPAVAAVDGGVVSAVAEGSATITFTVVDGYGVSHSASCEIEVSGTSGIGTLEADESAAAEYYNLNGVRVDTDTLIPGLYIKRQGTKTVKILVK